MIVLPPAGRTGRRIRWSLRRETMSENLAVTIIAATIEEA
jgi:hypothetical protein